MGYGDIYPVTGLGWEAVIPRGDAGDVLVLGAESLGDDSHIELKEVVLKARHPWAGQPIRDLDIFRQSVIVLVERRRKPMIPNGDLVLSEGDKIILCTKLRVRHSGP